MLLPSAEASGAFVVDIALRNERGGKLVQAFVDTDSGITIDECANISREFARHLDQSNLIQTSYRLEVSSPGIDKPMRLLRQYQKNVGRRFKVTYEGAGPFQGKLQGVRGEVLDFLTDTGAVVSIDFSKIIESKVELPW
jgi:ribosome maturation factor RimP